MQSNENNTAAVVSWVVIIGLGVLLWNVVIAPIWDKQVVKYDSPWWNGTQTLRVCDAFDSSTCYDLPVTSNGERVTAINWPNGGRSTASRSSCAKAGSNEMGADRFCTIIDQRQAEWDIFPN